VAKRSSPSRSQAGSLLEDEGGDLMAAGRALLGWLPDEAAHRLLCCGRRDLSLSIAAEARLAAVWDGVSRRGPPDPVGVVTASPPELAAHRAALRQVAPAAFDPAYELCMVDLSRVCALAEAIIVECALARTASARDLAGLADLTLPVAVPSTVLPSFDEELSAWVIVSDNPNLRLVGSFSPPADGAPGAMAMGFLVRAEPSRMTVAHFEGRYFLEDGYHRAIGLLSRGIAIVPALVHDVEGPEWLSVRGILPEECWRGPHPPVLLDYVDDAVSVDVWIPRPQKIIVIRGFEVAGAEHWELVHEY
jgi:hypothetical protein